MTTLARIGHGTTFAIFDTTLVPPAYVVLAEVTNITPPALARDMVEATHTESPDKWREFIPGLRDAGEVTLELNFLPEGAATTRLLALINSDEPSQSRIRFNDAAPEIDWVFTAFLSAFEPEAPVEDKMTASVTFKLTGKPAFIV
jgi:hypothetical protein